MIAIINAATQRSEMHGLDDHLPLPLFPLGDRPILHHVVDFLIGQGVRRFEFMLGHFPEKIENYLGDGARWGCSFGFHLLPVASDPLRAVERIAAGLDSEIVLGRGDRLPEFQLSSVSTPTMLLNGERAWTGWAVLPPGRHSLAALRTPAPGETKTAGPIFTEMVVSRELSFENVQTLVRSQQDILNGTFATTEIGGSQTEAGIWISRNVSLHSTAKLVPPVYLGPNCRIEAGAKIGPYAVISEGSIIDEQSSVTNSVVAPRTYIGQGLELDHVIVDRNRLVNTTLETAFLVSDSFLLSGLSRQKKPWVFRRIASRVGALALFLLLLPIAALSLLVLFLTGKCEFVNQRALRLPTLDDARTWTECGYLRFHLHEGTRAGWWTYFVAEVWPGLLSVMMGDMYLVGVKPRSLREVEMLPGDWRSIYLSSKAGLVTEALVMFGRNPSEDELYTAEAYYTAVESIHHDVKLLRLFLSKVFVNNDQNPGEVIESSLEAALENAAER